MTARAGIPGDDRSPAGAALRRLATAACARPKAAGAVAAAGLGAALVWGAFWVADGPAGMPAPGAVPATLLAAPTPAGDRSDVRRGRCANCGFVVGIRAVQPAGFEFTVRMRDGSMRTSTATSRGTWHIGDPVMLMGDAAARGR